MFPNMTDEVKEDVHKNWLYYDETYLIDVPPSLTDFVKYRASLGHKVLFQKSRIFIIQRLFLAFRQIMHLEMIGTLNFAT